MALHHYPLPGPVRVLQPDTLPEAWELRRKYAEDSVFVAGGTLLCTQWENGTVRQPRVLISLDRIETLSGIAASQAEDGWRIRIGARTTLAQCCAEPLLQDKAPILVRACGSIAAPSVRRLGTLGGNVLSATGDALPALLVLDARLRWYDGSGFMEEPLQQWLEHRTESARLRAEAWHVQEAAPSSAAHSPHSRTAEPILAQIRLEAPRDRPDAEERVWFYEKIGRREAFCPSVTTIAGMAMRDGTGRLHRVRMAASSGTSAAVRLPAAEELLEGRQPAESRIAQIYRAVMQSWEPGQDAFAGRDYRKQTCANLMASGWWRIMAAQYEKG